MPDIAVSPFLMTDVTMKIGADNYEKHLSTVRFEPSFTTATFQGLDPSAQFSFAGNSTWTCILGYAQDWDTPNSLSRYLFENEGEEIAVEFEPKSGGVHITATLTIAPGAIGGDVNAVATGTVTLGVKGRPVLGAAVTGS